MLVDPATSLNRTVTRRRVSWERSAHPPTRAPLPVQAEMRALRVRLTAVRAGSMQRSVRRALRPQDAAKWIGRSTVWTDAAADKPSGAPSPPLVRWRPLGRVHRRPSRNALRTAAIGLRCGKPNPDRVADTHAIGLASANARPGACPHPPGRSHGGHENRRPRAGPTRNGLGVAAVLPPGAAVQVVLGRSALMALAGTWCATRTRRNHPSPKAGSPRASHRTRSSLRMHRPARHPTVRRSWPATRERARRLWTVPARRQHRAALGDRAANRQACRLGVPLHGNAYACRREGSHVPDDLHLGYPGARHVRPPSSRSTATIAATCSCTSRRTARGR